jgi:peptide/nickel transport system permease protein
LERSIRRNWNTQLACGAAILFVIAFAAVFAPVISPYVPKALDLTATLSPPSRAHLAGTDGIGRDVLSRLMFGGRVSLVVAGLGMLGSIAFGTLTGLWAAFGGRWSEILVVRLIEVQLAFPYVLIAIAVTSAVRPSLPVLIVLMVLAGWAGVARVVRSVALQERAKDYVKAAAVVGASRRRIARKYIFPTVLPSLLVIGPMQMAAMIVFESTLSFLGMGVQPPTPTWGGIMLDGQVYLSSAWWLTAFPGATIFLASLSLVLIGEGLQRRLGRSVDVVADVSSAGLPARPENEGMPESGLVGDAG